MFDFFFFFWVEGTKVKEFKKCCSPREVNKGDEIAWYADGDYTVRNEYNPSIAYGFG